MDTLSFFNRILPHNGFRVLAEFKPNRRAPYQTFYETNEQAADMALQLDGQGKTIYHACASYKTNNNRKGLNVEGVRSFWLDVDVEPGNPSKYESLRDGLLDVKRVCAELGLPFPLTVKSGRGAHCYWPLQEDISADDWKATAEQFKAALDNLSFKQDRTRTADIASVLRPVGTYWRKEGEVLVEALTDLEPMPYSQFANCVGAYQTQHDLGPAASHLFAGTDEDDLGGGIEYPPSSADNIIKFCPTLRHVAEKKGDVEEPLWRAMLGVVKFTTEGERRCHEWSCGYADYDEAETQEKIDNWTAGPTTCEYFKRSTNGNQCDGCQQTCSSPIQLGYFKEETEVAQVVVEAALGEDPEEIPYWPKRSYHWNGRQICVAVTDDEGAVHWMPFSNSLYYVKRRVFANNEWHLLIRHQKKNKKWHEFLLPTSTLGNGRELLQRLYAQEISPMASNKNAAAYHGAFMDEFLRTLQQYNVEQSMHDRFGWVDKFTGFIIGNKKITESGEETVLCGSKIVTAQRNADFGTAGTIEGWSEIVNKVYGLAGAEPYQFAIGAAFASPLVELAGLNNWHGIPVMLTKAGSSGEKDANSFGKTTACLVAASMYGNPLNFIATAGKDGVTDKALPELFGVFNGLPLILDEMTTRDSKQLADLMYMASNGQGRIRLDRDGNLKSQAKWNLITLGTSNENIIDALSLNSNKDSAEATQVRVFEVYLPENYRDLWKDMPVQSMIEHDLFKNHYGLVGRVWLRYIMDNASKIRDDLLTYRARIIADPQDGSRERFYRDLIVSVVTALKHAHMLGLVDFNPAKVAKWAMEHMSKLRGARRGANLTPEDYVSSFITSLNGCTIVTKRFRDTRSEKETPLDRIIGPIKARLAQEDRVYLVTAAAVSDWCNEERVSPKWLLNHMDALGYLVRRADGSSMEFGKRRERIGKGTNTPTGQAFVYELDYDKVFGVLHSTGGNVVQLPTPVNQGPGSDQSSDQSVSESAAT